MEKYLKEIMNGKDFKSSPEDIYVLQYILNQAGYKGKDNKPIIQNGLFDENTQFAFNELKKDFKLFQELDNSNTVVIKAPDYTKFLIKETKKLYDNIEKNQEEVNCLFNEGQLEPPKLDMRLTADFQREVYIEPGYKLVTDNWNKIFIYTVDANTKEHFSNICGGNSSDDILQKWHINFTPTESDKYYVASDKYARNTQNSYINITDDIHIRRIEKFDDIKYPDKKQILKNFTPIGNQENSQQSLATQDCDIGEELQKLESLLYNLTTNKGRNDTVKVAGQIVSQYTLDELKEIQKAFNDSGISGCADLEIKQKGTPINLDNINEITGDISVKLKPSIKRGN